MSSSISKKKLREFSYLIGLGFPIILGWLIPSITGHDFRIWTLFVAIPAVILGIISPGLLQKPYQLWMALGHKLGWVNSRIILGLVFLLVVLPIALIMRLGGYDPLKRKQGSQISYRENKKTHSTDLTRIF